MTTGYFSQETLAEGITYYKFEGTDNLITKAAQSVRVLEIDLNNPKYKVVFKFVDRNTTSAIGKGSPKTIACVNAAYEQDAIYNRVNGVNYSEVTIRPTDETSKARRFWKHEAALVGDGKRKVGIIHGAKGYSTNTTNSINAGGYQAIDVYKQLPEKNIFASAPMLIDDYDPVGTRFVPAAYDGWTESQFSTFNGEDYRRHQGIRHPRTAVALTADNDLLLITVDGRYSGKAEGMSARELTNFIGKHFNPQWAINMDGGGSTSMYLKDKGGIVNHVCNSDDNGKSTWDKPYERKLTTFLLVQKDE